MDFVRSGAPFDTCQLGGMTGFVLEELYEGSLLRCPLCTPHAYVISREGMRKFLEYLPSDYASSPLRDVPHDVVTSLVWSKTYCPRDNYIIDQRWEDSNNEWFPDAELGDDGKGRLTWMQLKVVPAAIKLLETWNRWLTVFPVPWRPSFTWPCTLAIHDDATGSLHLFHGGYLARACFFGAMLWAGAVEAPPKGGSSEHRRWLPFGTRQPLLTSKLWL